MSSVSTVVVFCGAQEGVNPAYMETAAKLGKALADNKMHLVYGGGASGLMGALARASMAAGGRVTGIVPSGPIQLEAIQPGLTDLIHVGTMHERKQKMFKLAELFIVLPGGMGTLDEFFEMLTWHQIGLHTKPIYILNDKGYWTPLLMLLEQIIQERFARSETAGFYSVFNNLDELLAALA